MNVFSLRSASFCTALSILLVFAAWGLGTPRGAVAQQRLPVPRPATPSCEPPCTQPEAVVAPSASSLDKSHTTVANAKNNLITRSPALPPGYRANHVAQVDANRDGHPDLLVSGYPPGVQTLSGSEATVLFLNDGTGAFRDSGVRLEAPQREGPSRTGQMMIADVTSDGTSDVVMTGWFDEGRRSARLYVGDGTGGFTRTPISLPDVSVRAIGAADVNGDGHTDLFLGGLTPSSTAAAHLLLGDGTGSFVTASSGVQEAMYTSVAFGQFNADPSIDLAVAGTSPDGSNPVTALYFGDGTGRFTDSGPSLPTADPATVAGADVNGDASLDLVVATLTETAVYVNDGQGQFQKENRGLPALDNATIVPGDLDLDGRTDLLLFGTYETSEGAFRRFADVMLQDATGQFLAARAGLTGVFPLPSAGMDAILGDLDGDTDLDVTISGTLAVGGDARIFANRTVQTAPNRAPAFLSVPSSIVRMPGHPYDAQIIAGDADGDPISFELTQGSAFIDDLNRTSSFTVSSGSVFSSGNGEARLQLTPSQEQAGETHRMSVSYADDDGLTATAGFNFEVADDYSTVPPSSGTIGSRFSALATGDVDLNGFYDLLGGRSDDIRFLGDARADADLGLAVRSEVMRLADINGDDFLDLLVIGRNSPSITAPLSDEDVVFVTLLGDGTGAFTEVFRSSELGRIYADVSAGDVTGDGIVDVVISGWTGFSTRTPSTLLLVGDGSGSFSESSVSLRGVVAGSTNLGDVDDDGDLDLLLTGQDASNSAGTVLYLNDGNGTLTPSGASLPGVALSGSDLGDFDGDGDLDLLFSGRNGTERVTHIYRNDEGTFEPVPTGIEGGVEFSHVQWADVNYDGMLDVVLGGTTNSTNPVVRIYLNDNGQFVDAKAAFPSGGESRFVIRPTDTYSESGIIVTARNHDSRPYVNLHEPADFAHVDLDTATDTGLDVGTTGVTIRPGTNASGQGPFLVTVQESQLEQRQGIPAEMNVAPERFFVEPGPQLSLGSGAQLQFEQFKISGVTNPATVEIYWRDPPGRSRYDLLPSSSTFEKVHNVLFDYSSNRFIVFDPVPGEYVFASASNPLPVELAGFRAVTETGAPVLLWHTLAETGADRFEVQRATNGGAFGVVGTVEAAGTTTEIRRYRFADAALPAGTAEARYRLRQVDADGTPHLSAPITWRRPAPTALAIHPPSPHPVRQRATLHYDVPGDGPVRLEVYNLLGQRLQTLVDRSRRAGTHSAPFDAARLASGAYFIRLTTPAGTRTERVTVVR